MTGGLRRILVVTLAIVAAGSMGTNCSEDDRERLRRYLEGRINFWNEPAMLDRIEAIERDIGGIVDVSLEERMAELGVPGVTIAVVHRGVVEWVEAYGDRGDGEPMRRDTLLQAGSLSKPVTAVAIMRLVEDGALDLDQPINEVLQSWQLPDNELTAESPVTLRQVLSHTAGLNVSGFLGYNVGAGASVPSLLEVLDGLTPANSAPIRVVEPPGGRWLLSGGGYTILQQLIEDATGEDYPTWSRRNVMRPLRMGRSRFEQPLSEERLANAARGRLAAIPIDPPFAYPELPAAGLWSTALDMGRFVSGIQRSLRRRKAGFLDRESAEALFTPQMPAPLPGELVGAAPEMGLGFFLADGPDPGWFWNTGGTIGYASIIAGDLQGEGFGVVVLTNGFPNGRGLGWEIVNGVADVYDWPGWQDWGLAP